MPSFVNEKELGESIATNLDPKIKAAQTRLETWVEGLVNKFSGDYAVQLTIPLGEGRSLQVRVELVPK